MYRIYLRWANQRVSDKTATPSSSVAEMAFRELLRRGTEGGDLFRKHAAACLTLDNRGLEQVRFDGGNVDPAMELRMTHDD